MKFFPWIVFIADFIYELGIRKSHILTRERQFVHFLHFHVDSSDHSQTLQKKGIILNKNHEKKLVNIFGHFAKMAIRNLENLQNFKIYGPYIV